MSRTLCVKGFAIGGILAGIGAGLMGDVPWAAAVPLIFVGLMVLFLEVTQ